MLLLFSGMGILMELQWLSNCLLGAIVILMLLGKVNTGWMTMLNSG
jgi:hypothetical protein